MKQIEIENDFTAHNLDSFFKLSQTVATAL